MRFSYAVSSLVLLVACCQNGALQAARTQDLLNRMKGVHTNQTQELFNRLKGDFSEQRIAIEKLREDIESSLQSKIRQVEQDRERLLRKSEDLSTKIDQMEMRSASLHDMLALLRELTDVEVQQIEEWLSIWLRNVENSASGALPSTGFEREVVFPMKRRLAVLIKVLGNDHSAVKKIEREFAIAEGVYRKLVDAERKANGNNDG